MKEGMNEQMNEWMQSQAYWTQLNSLFPTHSTPYTQHLYLLWNQANGNIQDSFEGHSPSLPFTHCMANMFYTWAHDGSKKG